MPFPAPELFYDRPPTARARKYFSKCENLLLDDPWSLLPIEEPGSSQEMAGVRNGLNLSYAGDPMISDTTQSQPCASVVRLSFCDNLLHGFKAAPRGRSRRQCRVVSAMR